MIGGEDAIVAHLDPIFRTLAPGVEMAARTPGRRGPAGAVGARLPALRRPRRGAFREDGAQRHRVRRHGAPIAEGLAILKKADIGLREHAKDAETAPLRDPRVLPVPLRHGRGRRGLAARQRDQLVAARPDGRRAARGSRRRELLGPRLRLGRGALDGARRDRGGRARARARDARSTSASARAARPTTPTSCCRRCASSSAALSSARRAETPRIAHLDS